MNLRLKFGQNLRDIRRRKNITQEKLAEEIEVSVEFISLMERGINAPSFETLECLSEALNLSVAKLFTFNDEDS